MYTRILLTLACLGLTLISRVASAQSPGRSWFKMTTGNGHGFQIFSRRDGKLEQFLEHPYRFVAPLDERRDGGVSRRDLMHDAYFGVRLNGQGSWLDNLTNVVYEDQSHIILATESRNSIQFKVRYFAPFGLEANALIMTISATNTGDTATDVGLAAKVNLKFGPHAADPSDQGEDIRTDDGHFIETGVGGGHAIYAPIGATSIKGCGSDSSLYNDWNNGNEPSAQTCTGDNQVMMMGNETELGAGETLHFGMAVLFVNDNPNVPQADDFKDYRSVDDVRAQWSAFIGEQDTAALIESAKAEFEAWRVSPESLGLTELTPDEIKIWRQSESVLRMGQVREPMQANRRNFGMFLAALPEGEWHTGWVRDGVYAIVAQAMNGHLDEAREGVNFLLNAWAGFFSSARYLGRDYRISSVRYYGNGKEEGDFNAAGPNVETDGFGLALWGARAYLHYSCDKAWLDQNTDHDTYRDTVYEALLQTAQDIDALLINNLPAPECSIWETHWDYKQIFTYTAATQIRGLFDFAAIAELYGDTENAAYYRQRGQALLDTTVRRLVHPSYDSFVSHFNTVNSSFFVDGSTVEMLSWNFVDVDDPVYQGTMRLYERLETDVGGYKRLEQQLSLTGGSQATRYDLSQWILLDLRIGEAWRKMGNTSRAEELLRFITDSAIDNDHLIPELFDPTDGRYDGVVPMVGYGAGAWQVAQLEKYGKPFPDVDVGWAHCDLNDGSSSDMGGTMDENATDDTNEMQNMNTDDEGMDNAQAMTDDMDNTNANSPSNSSASAADPQANTSPYASDNEAGLCLISPSKQNTLGLLILLALIGVRRREGSARS